MKKYLALLLAIVMVLSLCACAAAPAAKDDAPADNAPAADAADGKLIKVGIINNDPNESGYRTANDILN